MHWKITALWGGKKVELRETQRAVTPFGGLVVFFEFLRRIGYCEAVRQHLPFSLTSPNAIDPVKTFTAFLLSVVAGARRFAHTSLLRADAALHTLLGISRFPIDDTVRNLFLADDRSARTPWIPDPGCIPRSIPAIVPTASSTNQRKNADTVPARSA